MTASPSPPSHIDYPDPTESAIPLEVALRRRRSVRELAAQPLTDAEIGQLLWAAQGVTADWGGRTAPSAGALYPLEVYAVTPTRALHYLSKRHRAQVTAERDLRPALAAAALDQAPVGQAPVVIAVVAVPRRAAR